MGLKALLTVDLNNTDSERRKKFNAEMAARKWSKLQNLTTAWVASFQPNVSRDEALRVSKHDVKEAANAAEIKEWHAAVQLGPQPTDEFNRISTMIEQISSQISR